LHAKKILETINNFSEKSNFKSIVDTIQILNNKLTRELNQNDNPILVLTKFKKI